MQPQKLIKIKSSVLPKVVTLLCICTFLSTKSQETNAHKFGNGLINLVGKYSTWSLKIGLRFQTLATSKWDVNNGLSNPKSSMLITRAPLKFDGFAYAPKLKYKLN